MSREIIRFSDTETEKWKLHCNKNPIFFKDVDPDKKILSNKVAFHKKRFQILYWIEE